MRRDDVGFNIISVIRNAGNPAVSRVYRMFIENVTGDTPPHTSLPYFSTGQSLTTFYNNLYDSCYRERWRVRERVKTKYLLIFYYLIVQFLQSVAQWTACARKSNGWCRVTRAARNRCRRTGCAGARTSAVRRVPNTCRGALAASGSTATRT